MESNGYEHQLFQAVKALAAIAEAAYWETHGYCGEEKGTTLNCLSLSCYDGCHAIEELDKAIATLEAWSC